MARSPNTTMALSLIFIAMAGVFWLRILPPTWVPRSRFVPETAAIGVILFGLALYQFWQKARAKT